MSTGESRGARALGVVVAVAVLSVIVFLFLRPTPRTAVVAASAHATATHVPDEEAAAPTPAADERKERQAEATRKRNELREKIVEAIARRDAGAPEPARAAVPAAAKPAAGRYTGEYIQKTFREDMMPLVRQCYESALVQKPELAGKLVLNFTITGDPDVGGVVDDADIADESTLHDDGMRTCVRESLMTLTFDKPPSGGGSVTVRYPILFHPGPDPDEEADAGAAR